MKEFEKEMNIIRRAKEVPLTFDRIEDLIYFVANYARRQEQLIENFERRGKDITHLIYERDMALYALGLGDKPKPYWINNDNFNKTY